MAHHLDELDRLTPFTIIYEPKPVGSLEPEPVHSRIDVDRRANRTADAASPCDRLLDNLRRAQDREEGARFEILRFKRTIAVENADLGIGQIGGRATEGIARQPDATARIQTAMIIAAALVEGVALFVAVIAFLIQGKITY